MHNRIARNNFPDFADQLQRAKKLDGVDPSVASLMVESGQEDGDRGDDVISVSRGSWPASSLKPSQTSMVLGKALGMALFMLKSGKVGGDLGAIVSKDKHILDGHHRWAATIFAAGSKGKVGGYGADQNGKELLKVLNVVSKGMFGVRNGNPGSGDLSQFTESNVREMLTDFTENGIGGSFPWSAESVRQVLEGAFGSVEEGIKTMSKNAGLITTSAPSWAPARKQMPVIDPSQVPAAANALNQGQVDWNDPHRKEGTSRLAAEDRTSLIRMASSLPVGSETRRAILSGLRVVARMDKGLQKLVDRAESKIKGQLSRITLNDAQDGHDDLDKLESIVNNLRNGTFMDASSEFGSEATQPVIEELDELLTLIEELQREMGDRDLFDTDDEDKVMEFMEEVAMDKLDDWVKGFGRL